MFYKYRWKSVIQSWVHNEWDTEDSSYTKLCSEYVHSVNLFNSMRLVVFTINKVVFLINKDENIDAESGEVMCSWRL